MLRIGRTACRPPVALGIGGTATAANLITTADIKNGTIKAKDLSKSAKRSLKGNRGPRGLTGPAGPQGATGAPGPTGPAGPSGISEITEVEGEGVGIAVAACPSGTRPVSGGGAEMGTGYIWLSGAGYDDAGNTGWIVAGDEGSDVVAWAYCSAGVSRITFADGHQARLTVGKVRAMLGRR